MCVLLLIVIHIISAEDVHRWMSYVDLPQAPHNNRSCAACSGFILPASQNNT